MCQALLLTWQFRSECDGRGIWLCESDAVKENHTHHYSAVTVGHARKWGPGSVREQGGQADLASRAPCRTPWEAGEKEGAALVTLCPWHYLCQGLAHFCKEQGASAGFGSSCPGQLRHSGGAADVPAACTAAFPMVPDGGRPRMWGWRAAADLSWVRCCSGKSDCCWNYLGQVG